MKGKLHLLALSLFSAFLLSLAWYWHLSIIIFFAFAPLLILEHKVRSSGGARAKLRLFAYSYITFFIWNVLVTWWIVYASFGGACMAMIFNALLMSIVFVIYSNLRTRINTTYALWFLLPCWIAWEHIHTLWDITWTWLTLGNVFAFNHNWVQWYEFTGTSGGTLWVLIVNILAFKAIKNRTTKILSRSIMRIAAAIIIPILLSYILFFIRSNDERKESVSVVVVQPNIDPYSEKFYVEYEKQFSKMLNMIRGKINSETDYLVLPETFITGLDDDLNEENLSSHMEIQWFRDSLINKFPDLKIITGGNTYKYYINENDITITSRKDNRNGFHYDVFNSAIYIDAQKAEVYHKSKLVPGVERMPFPALLKPLESMAIDMGGTMGSLGTQDNRAIFKSTGNAVAPVICYESVYADFVADYVRLGADMIFIITNDGWWEDTPGYIHHLNYARLRAIENRREIARSANTGISCFIDAFGNIHQATPWWKEAVIEREVLPNDHLTFFSRFGDLLSYASLVLVSLLIFWALIIRFKAR